MSEVAKVSAAQLAQGQAATESPRPRISLGQIFAGTGREIVEVLVELVHRDESQAREEFEKGKLEELAASIRLEGIIEPLELRPHPERDGHFVIVWGERRWRAAQLAGLATVPALINGEPKHVRRRQLYENVMREDLNGVELARILAQTMEEDGLDTKGMAEQLRWPLRKVQRLVEIHEAPAIVKTAMVKGLDVEGGRRVLGAQHALDIIRAYRHYAKDDKSEGKAKATARLEKLLEKVLSEEWSSRKLQTFVSGLGKKSEAASEPKDAVPPAEEAATEVADSAEVDDAPLFEMRAGRLTVDVARARSTSVDGIVLGRLLEELRSLVAEFERRSTPFTTS